MATGCLAQADSINGFNGGLNWTLNNGSGSAAQFTDANTLQLTSDYGQSNSAFYNTAVAYQSFTASFNYTMSYTAGGINPADGFTFVVQNDSRGATAIGGGGSDLGYSGGSGITPSIAFALNQYSGHTLGINVISGGTSSYDYFDVSPVNVQDPLAIQLTYDGNNLGVTLTDTSTAAVYSSSFAAPQSLVGSSTAFVGFTGGTGGGSSTQSVSNFQYNATPEPASMIALGMSLLFLKRRKKA